MNKSKKCKICKNDGLKDVYIMEDGVCWLCFNWINQRAIRIANNSLKEIIGEEKNE